MSGADGLIIGSLAFQLLLWVRTRRVRSASPLHRLLDLLGHLPVRTRLLVTAVHVSLVLQLAAPEGSNAFVLLRHVGPSAEESDLRPSWDDAYRGDMSSGTRPAAEGVWRPAR